MKNTKSFQDIILDLQQFWSYKGFSVLQPYDLEMGAGSFHPATVLRGLSEKELNIAFVQPSRRPTDSRKASHPNRLARYYQFQVVLKPAPHDMQDLYIESLEFLGISIKENDILFSEDDWESPSLGASGLGWEILCNGSEISQFTYMQQIGGIAIKPLMGEITYGLERLALQIQDKESVHDIVWNRVRDREILYKHVHPRYQQEFAKFNIDLAEVSYLEEEFSKMENIVDNLIAEHLPAVAYDYAIKSSHIFNLLDSRAAIGVIDRAFYISKIRHLVKKCCQEWLIMNSDTQLE